MLKNKKDLEPIRIWIVGCSTGEEVFSIAILLDNHIRTHKLNHDFKIFATDVDGRALNSAGQGSFHINISNELEKQYLANYFLKSGDKIQIIKRIREKIVFSNHNLLKDPPFIRMDMISCRNLLIYLDNKAQKKALLNFQFALNKMGYLFLGNSESLGDLSKFFRTVDSKWKIFQSISDTKQIPTSTNPEDKITTLSYKSPIRSIEQPQYRFKENPETVFQKYLSSRFSPSSIFIDKDFNIHYIQGDAGERLRHQQGLFQNNLLKMVSPELAAIIRNGIRRIESDKKDVIIKDIVLKNNNGSSCFDLTFHKPDKDDFNEIYLVHFSDDKQLPQDYTILENVPLDEVSKQRMDDLENELKATKTELQNVVEELETSNEELQSSNEELMASNEELQSTNEELQSVNEELYTVNSELQEKNKELVLLNNDISNLLDSTDIGTIFLDTDLRIRKFTPALTRHFNLQESDIGRPIASFASEFNSEIQKSIINDSKEVLGKLKIIEKEIQDNQGNHYLKRISPFITTDKKIDGVVITLVDITELKEKELKLAESEKRFREVFENSPVGKSITGLDGKLTVNSMFSDITGYSEKELNKLNWKEITHPDDIQVSQDAVKKMLESTESVTFRKRYIHKNGHTVWTDVRSIANRDKEGKPVNFFTSISNITDLVKSEIALKESEQRFRKFSDELAIPICNVDNNTGKIQYINSKFISLFGYDLNDIPNLNEWWQKAYPDETYREWVVNNWNSAVATAMNTNSVIQSDIYAVHCKYGETKYISIGGTTIGDEFLATFIDITEQRQAEELLKESEERFKLALTGANAGVWDWWTNSQDVYYSDIWKAQLGYKSDELENTFATWEKLLHAEDKERMKQAVNDFLAKPSDSFIAQFRMMHKDGLPRWIHNHAAAIVDESGKVVRMFGVHTDVTELKEAEFDLKERNKELNGLNELGLLYDKYNDNEILYTEFVNKVVPESLHYVNSAYVLVEINDKKYCNLPDFKLKKNQKQLYSEIKVRGIICGGLTVAYTGNQEFLLPFEQDLINNYAERISFMEERFRFLEEIKKHNIELDKARKDAEVANIYKNQFLANMSHEIRTPMNGVVGFADLLDDENLTSAERKKYVEIIKNGSNQLLNLVNDIIDISKIEAGELQLVFKPCNLREMFETLESTFNEIKKNKKGKERIQFIAHIPQSNNDHIIETDPNRLQQVLTNLLGNSLKFSEKDSVEFGYIPKNDAVQFFVKDHGIGIPKDKLDLIFNRFEQLDQTDPCKNEGTGLGLSISSGIIKLLKGKCHVESVVGEGTTFLFEIPAKYVLPAHPNQEGEQHPEFNMHKTNLLIVDDEPVNIEFFKAVFKDFEGDIKYAMNGREAVDIYINNPGIDVVLMDIKMTIMGGFEAANLILQHNPSAKIIAQTAYAMSTDRDKCLQNGFVGYIAKPIDKKKLTEIIKNLMTS